MQLTSQQTQQLQTWTARRDEILAEIRTYSIQLDDLRKSTKDEGLNLEDLHRQISEAKGRLQEILALEERTRTSIPVDIAELTARKSRLESEIVVKETDLINAVEKHGLVVIATEKLQAAHDKMKDQAAIVDKVTGELVQLNTKHLSDANVLMAEIRTVATEVIEKGNENIKQTGIILEKLPKYIFELQKPIKVRRVFTPPEGTVIEPEKQ